MPSTHTNNVLRTSLGSKHTEDTSTAANIKDGLALEDSRVVEDRVAVGTSADGILQHLLVNAYKGER